MFMLSTQIGTRYIVLIFIVELGKKDTHLILTNIKMIFFDLDDTLIGSTQIYDRALEKTGIDPSDSLYATCRKEVKEILGTDHVSSHHRLLYFKRYLENKSQFSAQKLINLIEDYEKNLTSEIKKEWDALNRDDFFQKLSSQFKLGLITNETTRTQILKLKEIDPQGIYFKRVVTSEEVGVQKPNPRIFQIALARAELKSSEALFVGDSVVNDLEPAQKMNFHVLGTREFLDESARGAQFKWLDRLTDLHQLIS